MKQKDVGKLVAETGLYFIKNMLERPGIRAYMEYQIERVCYGWSEDDGCPESIGGAAENIASFLDSMAVIPSRIAIDGVPGSGKSSLASALGRRLGMGVECLDHRNMDEKIQFDKDRTIYEHHRLLRTQDTDAFDVIIYIDEPPAISKEKVLHRKRGAYLVDVMDYEKLKQIGSAAFSMADGQMIAIPQSHIKLKLKPRDGFKDKEKIREEIRRKGLNLDNLNKEQSLFLFVYGKASKGFKAYINPWAYSQELFSALSTAIGPNKRPGRGR